MGVFFASVIVLTWSSHLYYCLVFVEPDFKSFAFYIHIIIQTYIFTGLFITAHDSMHQSISKNRSINLFFGRIAAFLFAGLSYKKLLVNHKLHHKYPGTNLDPDFSASQNILIWWMSFLYRYISIIQFIIMAAAFNLFKLFAEEVSIISFWVVPAVLSTFQLFYFGTYRPHMQPHTDDMNPHNARTLKKNHVWAMLSCYFFGYHHEHHELPQTPWWQMYKLKNIKN